MAASVCHDVGKPYEFDPANRRRWQADPADSGAPTFRHSVFGMHVCLAVGLPEEVAHVAVGHSFEGQYMGVSAECMIVRQAEATGAQVAAVRVLRAAVRKHDLCDERNGESAQLAGG